MTVAQKTELESRYKVERDRRVCDRIKAILLRDEGWSVTKIAQALRLHNDTVSRYIPIQNEFAAFRILKLSLIRELR